LEFEVHGCGLVDVVLRDEEEEDSGVERREG
jgi:hypothetical protein